MGVADDRTPDRVDEIARRTGGRASDQLPEEVDAREGILGKDTIFHEHQTREREILANTDLEGDSFMQHTEPDASPGYQPSDDAP